MRLRPAAMADAPAMARVMRAAALAEAARYPPGAAERWGSLPAVYHRWAMSAGGESRLVALAAGRVVGFAGWRGREVTALFVHPRAAGRGLGARLLAAVEAGAAQGGARSLTVLAAVGAVDFYLALGWRDAGSGASPLPGGGRLPARRLRRPARRATSP
jgi:GNAT superfamily N-acetyltransferase